MTRADLSTRQARKLYDALVPTLGFLTQLEERLGELGMPGDDGYLATLKAARDAYRALTLETMRLTHDERGGRPEAP